MKTACVKNIVLTLLIVFLGLNKLAAYPAHQPIELPQNLNAEQQLLKQSMQLIVVSPSMGHEVDVALIDKNGSDFSIFANFKGVIGKNGFAGFNEKKEGDLKTPTGVFSLTQAFGYNKMTLNKFPYKQVLRVKDKWIDDPLHKDYNLWIRGPTQAKSFEYLRRSDHQYEMAVIVDYNFLRVPYAGSAIFIHIWKNQNSPTAGCLALPKDHMYQLAQWLNEEKKPVVILNRANWQSLL